MIKQGVIVKAVVFDGQGRILLVRRSETAPRRPLEWDLPGGFVENDSESFQEACLRELAEETGITKVIGALKLAFAESELEKDRYDMSWLYFTMHTENPEVKLSYEHDKFTWATLEESMELIAYDRQLRSLAHVQKAKELEK